MYSCFIDNLLIYNAVV